MTGSPYKQQAPTDAPRPPLERGLLVDKVAQRIRTDILTGRLLPGQRIPVSALSEEMGVSPIPVREALQRLEAEALIQSEPHRAPTVADVAIEELGEIYSLRRLLECDTAKLAVSAANPRVVSNVQQALARLLAEDPQLPESAWWEAHTAFHQAVLEGGLDPWRRRFLSLLWQSSQRYQRLNTLVFGQTDGDASAHIEIGEAFAAGDADRLARALASHLDRTESTVRDGYPKQYDGGESTDAPAAEHGLLGGFLGDEG